MKTSSIILYLLEKMKNSEDIYKFRLIFMKDTIQYRENEIVSDKVVRKLFLLPIRTRAWFLLLSLIMN